MLDVCPQMLPALQDVRAFRRSLFRWYRHRGRDLPWRRTRDPYAILVSEFMLQQTQVATVIPYYQRWLRRFPDFATLARASENQVLRAWQGLGYYARARNLHATAKTITHQHGGNFPREIERAQQLSGIGKYTAHAVATFAFDQSVPIVEANTGRVLARLFNLRESIDSNAGRNKLWELAQSVVPKSHAGDFNSALLDLGALICIARKPRCNACPVRRFCRAKNPAALPVRRSRPKTRQLIETHALVVRHNRILLEQSRNRWRGMWILPRLEPFNPAIVGKKAVYESVFPFTHHRVTLSVYSRAAPKRIARGQQWFTSTEDVPMPSPHRRAVQTLWGAVPPRLDFGASAKSQTKISGSRLHPGRVPAC